MKYTLFLYFTFIALISCTQKQESTNTQYIQKSDNEPLADCNSNDHQPKYQFRWIPQDTLVFDYLGMIELWAFDSKTQRYLSRDWLTKNVMEFSVNGKLLNQWNFTGSGPEGVGGEIYGGTYVGDSAFVILGDKGYFFYDREGNFIRKVSFNNSVPLGNISILTKIFLYQREKQTFIAAQIAANATEYDGTMKGYYEHATLLSENDLSEAEATFSHYIKYPPNSIYRDENNYILSANDVYLSMDKSGNVYAIFASEPKIYLYDINKAYQMQACLNTSPEYFDHLPLSLPYNQGPSANQSFEAFVGTSKYQSIYTFQDSLIGLVYSRGLDENLLTDKLSRTAYNDSLYQFNESYFQVFSGMKKLCSDIRFPKGTSTISYVHTLDKVVFSADVDQLEYEPQGSLFYVFGLEASDGEF